MRNFFYYCIIIVLTIGLSFKLSAQSATINTCEAKHEICPTAPSYEVCAKIDPKMTIDSIAYFILDWGDDTEIDRIYPGDVLDTLYHTYDLRDFYRTCKAPMKFTLFLETTLIDSSRLNNAIVITLSNPAIAEFRVDPSTVCLGKPVTLIDESCPVSWLESIKVDWGDGNIAIEDLTHYYEELGTYTVTLIAKNACGSDTTTRKVKVIEPPEPKAIPIDGIVMPLTDPYIVCLGDEGKRTVTIDGCISEHTTIYDWRVISGRGYRAVGDQDSCIFKIEFNRAGLVTVELGVMNECRIEETIQLEFEIIAANVLLLDPQPDECYELTYTPKPLNRDAIYELNGTVIDHADFPIELGIGQYTISAEMINECGIQIVTDTFNVSPPEEVKILLPAADTVICAGDTLFLSFEPAGGTWESNGMRITGQNTAFYTTETPGNYTLIYNKGKGECLRSDTITVTVEGVTIAIEDIQACPWQSSVEMKANPPGGSWSSPQCPTCIDGNNFILSNLSGNNDPIKVFYTIETSNGCTSLDSTFIEILEPKARFSFMGTPCSNSALEVDYSASTGNRFLWRINGEVVSGPPFANVNSGINTFELVAISGHCRDSISHTIEVYHPPLSAEFTADINKGCSPLEVNFTPLIGFSDSEDYSWSFNRFSGDIHNGYDPPTGLLFENTSEDVLIYAVEFKVENICGQTVHTEEISVLPDPVARIGIDSTDTGCSPYSVILTNRSGGLPDICSWTISDGFTLNSCQDTFHRTFYAHDEIEKYIITLVAENVCGVSTTTDTVTVIPPGVKAFYNLDKYEICAFDTIQFKDASTPVPTSWLWNFGDGTSSDIANPRHAFTSPEDTFVVSLTVSTGCGSDKIKHTVTTLAAPKVDFTLPSIACEGQPVIGIMNSSDPDVQYLWEYGDNDSDKNVFEPEPVFNMKNESVSIKLTVTNFPDGCTNSLEKDLFIRSLPLVDFDLSDTLGCEALDGQTINLSQNANSWLWRLDGVNKDNAENTGYSFGEEGIHEVQLIASWDNVCIDSLSKRVTVLPCEVYIPNAFSPNNDGKNDYFTIFGTPTVKQVVSLEIFDRWGETVFKRTNFPANIEQEGWNGYIKDRPVLSGVFLWKAKVEYVDGTTESYSGDLTLIR